MAGFMNPIEFIIKPAPENYEFRQINNLHLNHSNFKIYQFKLENCYHYFYNIYNNYELKYVMIRENRNMYHLFPFDNDVNTFDEYDEFEFKEYINNNKTSINEAEHIEHIINKFNVMYITDINHTCFQSKDLNKTKQKIKELNALLKQKCNDELFLNFDYIYNLKPPDNSIQNKIYKYNDELHTKPNDLLLCLYNSQGCISSIEVFINDGVIKINSKTKEDMENKKYNKLLRSAIVIISKCIDKNNNAVESEAVNYISAWLMIKTFNGTVVYNYKFFNFLQKEQKDQENITFDDIKTYYRMPNNEGLTILVDTNDDNIRNAETVFNNVIDDVNFGCIKKQDKKRKQNSTPLKRKKPKVTFRTTRSSAIRRSVRIKQNNTIKSII